MRFHLFLAIAALAGCTASDVQAPQVSETTERNTVWSYAEQIDELRAASCPDNVGYLRAQEIDIRVIEAERGSATSRAQQLTGLSLAGAWQLESSESNFGGLSGLDVLASGALLAITDAGSFVSIGVDSETGTPDGLGTIAYMRDTDGNYFANKRDGDSEGLSLRDGTAFVSFEQDHRVAAFNLERCGSAARAAPVLAVAPVVGGKILSKNGGPEALAFRGDTLIAGFELRRSSGSPVGTLNADGSLTDLTYTAQPDPFVATGMDVEGAQIARLFRAYDPVRGPRALLHIDRDDQRVAEALFKQPLPVDNFEGVAFGENPDGQTRVWIISDDNFNRDQRTLLLALDLQP